MNWQTAFLFFTLMSSLTLASPAGLHNVNQLGKLKSTAYMAPAGESTCSLNELGWVNCWGSNAGGQLGNNSTTNSSKPIPIKSGMIQLDMARSAGGSASGTTYAVTLTGVLMSWGDNVFGKLGTGVTDGVSFTPQIVDPTTRYKYIDAQYRHTCAITTTNTLRCWGYNVDANLGDGTTILRNSPIIIDGGTNYKTVAVGAFHSCGITTGNTMKCWGLNDNYQLGDGSTTQRFTPITIDGATNYASVSAGMYHTCAITTGGTLKCWGNDGFGQIGDGAVLTSPKTTPSTVDGGTTYSMVSVADSTTCAITTGGTLKCWGENTSGQLGDGSTTDRHTPTIIDSGNVYISVSTGGYHTCGITNSKIMKCWGVNDKGQLGTGSVTGILSAPQQVTNP